MTDSTRNPEVVFQGAACDAAFHAGQVLEKVLMERALERVKEHSPEATIVTVDDVGSCIDAELISEVVAAVAAVIHEPRIRRLSA